MGRMNARDAGKKPRNPQTILGLSLLTLSTLLLVVIHTSFWVSHTLTGTPESLAKNPFQTIGKLIGGDIVWTTTAIATSIVLTLVVLAAVVLMLWLFIKRGSPVPVDAAAKQLAAKKDISSLSKAAATTKAKQWLSPQLATTHPGLRLGKIPKTKVGLYSTWEDLYLIIFGPRMGKTTSQVIPAIVDAPGPVLTTSNKRDIIDDTIGVTATRGEVYAFDPQRIAVGFEQQLWFFDPLDIIRRDPLTMDAAATELADIFKCASREENSTGDSFFVDGGRDLLGRLFLAATVSNQPITDVYRWVNSQDDRTPVGLLRASGEWDMQAEALESTYNITERTRSGIFSQAVQMAAPLGRKEAAKWVTPSAGSRRFSPEDFVRSAHDTLYVLSKEGADNAAALTTALTAAVMKAAETYGEENGGRLPIPLVAPLDEAANVVRWPQLPKLYSHYGSRSIILMTILQSYAQGVGVWGEEGMESLWSSAAILMYGGGVRDEKMLSKLEALIGDYEKWETSVSNSTDSYSVSKQTREKKILTVAELASLGDNRAVVFAAKRRPVIAELEPFWTRTYWPDDIKAGLRIEN